jgi:hypothetical protein
MKPMPISARRCVTRTSRHDPRGAQMESIATEFALLAQRRTRLARQVDLLSHQLAAANANLKHVQSRMGTLALHMDEVDPQLRPGAAPPPPAPPQRQAAYAPAPAYPPPLPAYRAVPQRGRAAHGTMTEVPMAAPVIDPPPASHAKPVPKILRPVPRRRPFPTK